MNEFAALRPSPPAADERAELVVERDASSAATARGWLARSLSRRPVPSAQLQDALLVLSELVTNAWRHGGGRVVVRTAFGANGEVHLYVSDEGAALPAVAPDEAHVGGWGLQIVESLASAWGVEPDDAGGKTVWATVAGTPR